MEVKEFYKACEDILETKTEFKEPKVPSIRYNRETGEPYRPSTIATRWGGREPGNGRFPGRGLIRVFGPTLIQVALNDPNISGIFNSMDDVLRALEKAMGTSKETPKIGDEIDVVIIGELIGKGTILKDYNEDQWIVEIIIQNSNGSKEKTKRYIDKEA